LGLLEFKNYLILSNIEIFLFIHEILKKKQKKETKKRNKETKKQRNFG
jgi:hypothetical protein